MTSAVARASCALVAAFLLIGTASSAQTPVKTRFEVVQLWTEDMLQYLAGEQQPPCSGAKLVDCKRMHEGMCDGTVDVAFAAAPLGIEFPAGSPTMQTETAAPKGFRLVVSNGTASRERHPFRLFSDTGLIELKFECANTGTSEDCPTGIFHVGLLRAMQLRTPYGELLFDLMEQTRVDPRGDIIVSPTEAMRKALNFGPHPFYRVRAGAQCFVVPAAPPIDWTLPVFDGPTSSSGSLGAVIGRVTPDSSVQWIYRTNGGEEISFDPDWVQGDWGYEFLMEQTVLDRRGEWVQLPARPFRQPVWLRLPAHSHPGNTLEPGPVYSLLKTVRARPKNSKRTVVFNEHDTIVIEMIGDRFVEIRKEEESDGPCSDDDAPVPDARKRQTFLVDVMELYDADLHLRVTPAYPKGC